MNEEQKAIEEMAKDLTETRAQGFKVENGELFYFSNLLNGYKDKFNNLKEICEEMNGMVDKINSLIAQVEFWQCEETTYKLWKDKLVEELKQARKETAREIFDTIIKALEERKERVKAFYGIAESVGADVAIRTIKELAKQFGVEIKE